MGGFGGAKAATWCDWTRTNLGIQTGTKLVRWRPSLAIERRLTKGLVLRNLRGHRLPSPTLGQLFHRRQT